jgi:N utilization substance protein A
MGSRVRNVMNELHGEKIDIVDYAEDPADFVANALSPARVSRVHVVDLAAREAQVIVPDYQLSLAIGKEGQNARLAARLTGWRIDIRSDAAPTASPEPASPTASPEPPARPATSVSPDSAAPASSSVTAASADATGASAPQPEPESSAQVRPGAGEARTR